MTWERSTVVLLQEVVYLDVPFGHIGIVRSESGLTHFFTSSDMCRNGTHAELIPVGTSVWRREDGAISWIEPKPTSNRRVTMMKSIRMTNRIHSALIELFAARIERGDTEPLESRMYGEVPVLEVVNALCNVVDSKMQRTEDL